MTDAPMSYEARQTIQRMLFATWAFLDSLGPELRAQAVIPDLDDPRRLDWDFIPKPDRAGVPLFALTGHQRTLAQTLLASGLSLRGYSQVLSVMATENILRELEAVDRGFGALAGDFRNPDGYWLSFYGRPGFEDTWGWRFTGHHLSLSFTIVAQRYLTVTPLAMGAMPIPAGALNPLGEQLDGAFQILRSLTDDARAQALIHDVAPADFVTRQVPHVGAEEWPDNVDLGIVGYSIADEDREKLRFAKADPSGLRGAELTGAQLDAVRGLILRFVETAPDQIAAGYRNSVMTEPPAGLTFAWAGGTEPNTPHYFRISTSTLLVEADNAVASGQHLHTVWRDLGNDLGHDLLLDHYQKHGHHGGHLGRRVISNRLTADAPLETTTWYPGEMYIRE